MQSENSGLCPDGSSLVIFHDMMTSLSKLGVAKSQWKRFCNDGVQKNTLLKLD